MVNSDLIRRCRIGDYQFGIRNRARKSISKSLAEMGITEEAFTQMLTDYQTIKKSLITIVIDESKDLNNDPRIGEFRNYYNQLTGILEKAKQSSGELEKLYLNLDTVIYMYLKK